MTSLASVKGPSVTEGLPPENETRAPLAVDCRPSSESSTPALASSSLYRDILASASASGVQFSSEMLGIMIIMKRIVRAPLGGLFNATTIERSHSRHVSELIL